MRFDVCRYWQVVTASVDLQACQDCQEHLESQETVDTRAHLEYAVPQVYRLLFHPALVGYRINLFFKITYQCIWNIMAPIVSCTFIEQFRRQHHWQHLSVLSAMFRTFRCVLILSVYSFPESLQTDKRRQNLSLFATRVKRQESLFYVDIISRHITENNCVTALAYLIKCSKFMCEMYLLRCRIRVAYCNSKLRRVWVGWGGRFGDAEGQKGSEPSDTEKCIIVTIHASSEDILLALLNIIHLICEQEEGCIMSVFRRGGHYIRG